MGLSLIKKRQNQNKKLQQHHHDIYFLFGNNLEYEHEVLFLSSFVVVTIIAGTDKILSLFFAYYICVSGSSVQL